MPIKTMFLDSSGKVHYHIIVIKPKQGDALSLYS